MNKNTTNWWCFFIAVFYYLTYKIKLGLEISNKVCYNNFMGQNINVKDKFLLVIDDTGFQANSKRSQLLQSEKTCFCGLLIQENYIDSLNELLSNMSKALNSKFGESEFHFTAIYNRQDGFKDIELEETLEIISTFGEIFEYYDIPIVVSTFNAQTKANSNYQALIDFVKANILKNVSLPKSDASANLFFTVLRANKLVLDEYENAEIFEAVCDEGLLKNGRTITIPLTDNKIKVKFESSAENKLLQLADFTAWLLTRTKHILDKDADKRKDYDEFILQVASSLPYYDIEYYLLDEQSKNKTYDEIINELNQRK